METAKLFTNGGSQAVRLPKSCRFEKNEDGTDSAEAVDRAREQIREDYSEIFAENGNMMVFDHKCMIRHNPDRRLEEIIDKHCFKQLDEFRKTH